MEFFTRQMIYTFCSKNNTVDYAKCLEKFYIRCLQDSSKENNRNMTIMNKVPITGGDCEEIINIYFDKNNSED
jgi:hypothetical protein